MERTILLKGQNGKDIKRFVVGIKNAYRQKRNRYLPNASPNSTDTEIYPLIQKKFCPKTDEEISSDMISHKILKVGKTQYLVPSNVLKLAQEFDSNEIVFNTYLEADALPDNMTERVENIIYAEQTKDKSAYCELAKLLDGRVAVGTGVFGNNEYQVCARTNSDGRVVMYLLADEEQMYDKTEITQAQFCEEIVALESQLLSKAEIKPSDYDVTKFRDSRAEREEQILTEFVIEGKLPEVAEIKIEAKRESDEAEKERLKALLAE